MSARALITISLVAAGVLAPAANADAAKKTSSYPTIKKIEPMRVSVGDVMTITGTGYLRGKAKNTVVFRRSGQRSVFVKADGLSTTRLRVVIPTKVTQVLGKSTAGAKVQLRVLAKRFGKTYTPLAKSPTIVPASATGVTPLGKSGTTPAPAAETPAATLPAADCDADGQPDTVDVNDDADLLPDVKEVSLGLNRCSADTDGDGMDDGWEYQSALDWNQQSCPAAEYPTSCTGGLPYPGKRPYPNALNPDQNTDHDSDTLPAWWEYRAWRASGKTTTLDDLWYSDGQQSSQDSNPADGCVGLVEAPASGTVDGLPVTQQGHVDKYPALQKTFSAGGAVTYRYGFPYDSAAYTLDTSGASDPGYGCLSDEERDEDGDFLSNFHELVGVMSDAKYIQDIYGEPPYDVEWPGTDALDADSDGDTVVDGLDDQDGDDFWNIEELQRGTRSSRPPIDQETGEWVDTGVRTGLWTDPYNPCLPSIYSKFCKRYILTSGTPWMPFIRNTPGADWPQNRWPLWYRWIYQGNDEELEQMVPDATPEIWRNAIAPTKAAFYTANPLIPAPATHVLAPLQPNDPAVGPHHPLPRPPRN